MKRELRALEMSARGFSPDTSLPTAFPRAPRSRSGRLLQVPVKWWRAQTDNVSTARKHVAPRKSLKKIVRGRPSTGLKSTRAGSKGLLTMSGGELLKSADACSETRGVRSRRVRKQVLVLSDGEVRSHTTVGVEEDVEQQADNQAKCCDEALQAARAALAAFDEVL